MDPLLSSSMQLASFNITIKADELTDISSYQTLWGDKNWKSYQAITKLDL